VVNSYKKEPILQDSDIQRNVDIDVRFSCKSINKVDANIKL
jgi:hypothetical protein